MQLTNPRSREARLRRRLHKCGLHLVKSRARNPELPSFGGYAVLDLSTNCGIFGYWPHEFSASLEEVEEWLASDFD